MLTYLLWVSSQNNINLTIDGLDDYTLNPQTGEIIQKIVQSFTHVQLLKMFVIFQDNK